MISATHLRLMTLGFVAVLIVSACSSSVDSGGLTSTPSSDSPTTALSDTTARPVEPGRALAGLVTVDGSTVTVEASATGFTVEFDPTDSSGATARLHLFIDRDPPSAGTEVPLGDPTIVHSLGTTLMTQLEPGSHVVWLVAADGADRLLNPPSPVSFEIQIEA